MRADLEAPTTGGQVYGRATSLVDTNYRLDLHGLYGHAVIV